MSKAGSSLLRTTLVRAAGTARKLAPQLAAIYYQQMTQRGKDHPGATRVVAAHLAERAWSVMRRGTPYVTRDTDGRPVTPDQAKTIIAGRWTVPHRSRPPAQQEDGEGPPESPRRTVHTGQLPPRHHFTPVRAARQADHLTSDPP